MNTQTTDFTQKHLSNERGALLLDQLDSHLEGRHVLGDRRTEGFRSMMRKSASC